MPIKAQCLCVRFNVSVTLVMLCLCVCVCLRAFTQGRRCVSAMCVSLLQCCEGGLGGVTLLRGWGGCGTRNCGKNHKDKQRFTWIQRPGKGQRSNEKVMKRSKDKGGGAAPAQGHTQTVYHMQVKIMSYLYGWVLSLLHQLTATTELIWHKKRNNIRVRGLFRERKRRER